MLIHFDKILYCEYTYIYIYIGSILTIYNYIYIYIYMYYDNYMMTPIIYVL